ncbi:hypothetical protein AWW67_07490 [Roseivirga seohaensis]|uniref:6-bladed beta-propeller n=1 Tax=Roseivirga seohaensis TaxID=1914963 RepID=A0A150XR52_9BACT|nr:BF3164 family lipoprotein [Roseivirga seohaensis]KYG81193.1 hypothetical protein AWW67_07490 [Roseivirga seohaensis]
MRAIRHTATYLIIFSVFSCSADKKEALLEEEPLVKTIEVTEFPVTIDLRSNLDSVPISSPLYKIRQMISTKDHLVFMNLEEPLFSVYDNQTGEYRGAFGFKGEGPLDLEFNNANASSFKSYGDNFLITDMSRIRVLSIDKKEGSQLLTNDDVKILESKKRAKDAGFFNNAFLANDNMVFTTDMFTKKHFVYIDLETGEQGDTIDFPDFHPEIPVEAYHHLYTSHTAPSLDKRKFVLAYQRFPVLRVYDLKKGSYTQINVKPENEQKKDIQADARGRSIQGLGMFTYYQKVVVSEKYIYAKHQEGSLERVNGEFGSVKHTGLEIHVFDWNGNPVKKLLLPDWVNPYTVTQNDEFIYFFHPENENYLYRKSMKD